MQPKTFEEKIKYYRENYFLDPQGSNSKMFMNTVNSMLEELLADYTGKRYVTEVKLNQDSTYETKIVDKSAIQWNINKMYDEGGTILPEKGQALSKTVDDLAGLAKGEIKFNHYFMGQMHPHDNIASFVAGLAGKFLNGNTIAQEVSPSTTYAEMQTLSWLADAFGYNPNASWLAKVEVRGDERKDIEKMLSGEQSSGNITVGGTTANLAAYIVARNKAFKGNDIMRIKGCAETGMHNKEGVILGSEYSHYSHEKICGYVGIGSENFIKVKTKDYRMNASDTSRGALRDTMWKYGNSGKKVIGIFATAGTTELGSIDDMKGIYGLINDFEKEFKYRPHFHVDAAHGGGFVFHEKYDPKKGGLLDGIQYADSITIDPHKMLYTNYSAGAILFKDKRDHTLLKQSASYLFKENGDINLGQYRTEGSIGLEGTLQSWASMKSLGREGLETIQENTLRMTQYLKQKLKDTDFEVITEPDMNLLCFRYNNKELSDEMNDEINVKAQEKMYNNGLAYISNDGLNYRKNPREDARKIRVFRAVLMHPYTTEKEVDIAVDELNSCLKSTLAGLGNKLELASKGKYRT